ncbi:hypothetical protein [Actinobacillus pleuropneumoniae]|uniref:hypothetical protein n=1 Tax=Actinobacillus pleuropneumoniae TaxID=715 RepID=UPI003D041187
MTITFSDLVTIYRQSEFMQNSDKALFCPNTEEECALLRELASDKYYEETAIEILSEDVAVGKSILLELNQPKFYLGRLFNSFEEMIKGDIAQLHSPHISQSAYFVKADKVASIDEDKPDYYLHYETVKQFIQQLCAMAAYTDHMNKKLVFFSKKTFELSLNISRQIDVLSQFLKEVNAEQLQLIQDFSEWLNDEETSSHIDEKKSILAFVFADTLPQAANIIDVLQQIKAINKDVKTQYALYLANFSYEKFVKKLTENSEKFIAKVNDTISKILPQFLGLPFLTAIPTALKSADNWLVYFALCMYCTMCYLGLTNQKLVLDNLAEDVKQFEQKGNIPVQLKNDWLKDKGRIDKLLGKQKQLYYLLLLSVIICFLYGLIKFFLQFHIL